MNISPPDVGARVVSGQSSTCQSPAPRLHRGARTPARSFPHASRESRADDVAATVVHDPRLVNCVIVMCILAGGTRVHPKALSISRPARGTMCGLLVLSVCLVLTACSMTTPPPSTGVNEVSFPPAPPSNWATPKAQAAGVAIFFVYFVNFGRIEEACIRYVPPQKCENMARSLDLPRKGLSVTGATRVDDYGETKRVIVGMEGPRGADVFVEVTVSSDENEILEARILPAGATP